MLIYGLVVKSALIVAVSYGTGNAFIHRYENMWIWLIAWILCLGLFVELIVDVNRKEIP